MSLGPSSLRFRLVVAVCGFLASPVAGAGEPYVPSSDDTVLVRLRASGSRPEPALEDGRQPAKDPAAVVAVATALCDLARREGDPRYLGRARSLLRPWWETPAAPAEILFLRARIHQGLHRFGEALEDLDRVLRQDPRHAGAWLLKASLHQVRGDYPAARRACFQVSRFADELTALTASASLRSLENPGGGGDRVLAAALERGGEAAPQVRAWAWTTLGEIRIRAGDLAGGEASLRRALELEPEAVYPLAALADVLLDQGRPSAVLPLLRGSDHPVLRLRSAEAAFRLDPYAAETRRRVEELGEAFAIDNWRGDDLHLREQARFVLRLRRDPSQALALAERNWAIQREPADARLLVEAAREAGVSFRLAGLPGEPARIAGLRVADPETATAGTRRDTTR